ncbi:glycine/betaine ABC transporter [Orenia metallireducens]|uniref:Glycine/betaine ABC transporter n=1 Tax=Orenia metallireducens TaxID=1413210 RepID=A0A1C0A994_9FIRM|nr:glycine/betaine ABC transporter [Orenia metallireducens]
MFVSVLILVVLSLTGCGLLEAPQSSQETQSNVDKSKGKVKIAYVQWASAEASTHIVQEVLERIGYEVETPVLQAGAMYQGTARGNIDAFVCAWLPDTAKNYWDKFGDQLVELNNNYLSAQIGIVVPEYVKIDSLAELKDYANKFEQRIVGIDPGAAEMIIIKDKVVPTYGLEDWQVIDSSGPAMTAELARAIKNKEWIAVAGWKPHWKWAKWDLKFLKDPELAMGSGEYIKSIGRPGIREDLPELAKFLEKYRITTEQLSSVMLKIQNGMEPKKAAKEFVDNNLETVNSWLTEDNQLRK